MSNFLSRLIDRTLGKSKVVQPLLTSIYVNEDTMRDGFPTAPPLAEENIDLEEKTEFAPFSEIETFSKEVGFQSVSPDLNNNTTAKNSGDNEGFVHKKKDSNDYVHKEANNQLEVDSRLLNRDEKLELSQHLEKSDRKSDLSYKKNLMDEVSPQIETFKNKSLSEKLDIRDDILESVHKKKKRKARETKKALKNSSFSQNINNKGTVQKRFETAKKIIISKKENIDTDKKENSLTPLVFKRSIHPEVSVSQEHKGTTISEYNADGIKVSPMPPTVKVTIGRIDVRAVKQQRLSHPQQRKFAPKPKLSLEDYLKQRSRGER